MQYEEIKNVYLIKQDDLHTPFIHIKISDQHFKRMMICCELYERFLLSPPLPLSLSVCVCVCLVSMILGTWF